MIYLLIKAALSGMIVMAVSEFAILTMALYSLTIWALSRFGIRV